MQGFAANLAVYTGICHTDLSDPESGVPRPAGPVPPLPVRPRHYLPPADMHRATFSSRKRKQQKEKRRLAPALGSHHTILPRPASHSPPPLHSPLAVEPPRPWPWFAPSPRPSTGLGK